MGFKASAVGRVLGVALAFLALAPVAWAQGKKALPSDFSVVHAPPDKMFSCSPIFFCRTRPEVTKPADGKKNNPSKRFPKNQQINWCMRYASAVLGETVAKKELLLIQIEPSVGLSRLKTIAEVLSNKSTCSGTWPPGKPPLLSGNGAKIKLASLEGGGVSMIAPPDPLEQRVVTMNDPLGPDGERGVVILAPEASFTNPEVAAAVGPNYQDPNFITSVQNIPSEQECSEEGPEWWEIPPEG